MDNSFVLPVAYKDNELEFECIYIHSDYTMRFDIMVNEVELTFEKDDEGNYRVINYKPENIKEVPINLLEAIIASLQKIT